MTQSVYQDKKFVRTWARIWDATPSETRQRILSDETGNEAEAFLRVVLEQFLAEGARFVVRESVRGSRPGGPMTRRRGSYVACEVLPGGSERILERFRFHIDDEPSKRAAMEQAEAFVRTREELRKRATQTAQATGRSEVYRF